MAQIIRQRTVTIPHNTPIDSLYSLDLELPTETVDSIDILVPPGPYGLMGFYLALSDQQVIPFEGGEFLIWNGQEKSWDLTNYPNTGDWQVYGYNLDLVYDHTIYFTFHDFPLSAPTPVVPTITFVSNPNAVAPVTL